MPTTVTVTVKPAGQGGNYLSLNLAEAGLDDTPDLVARDETVVIVPSGDWSGGSDNTSVTFGAEWVTDTTHKITVRPDAANRASPLWDATKYVLGDQITPIIPYAEFDGLQIATGGSTHGIRSSTARPVDNQTIIKNCFIRYTGDTNHVSAFYGVYLSGDNAVQLTINTIATGFTTSALSTGAFLNGGTNTNVTYLNCLAYANKNGYRRSAGDPIIRNCIAQVSSNDGMTSTVHASSSNNISDIVGDASGSNPQTGTVSFVNAAGLNFHLQSGDTLARGNGADLTSEFTTDMEGDARPNGSAWDIGPDQFTQNGSAAPDGVSATGSVGTAVATGESGGGGGEMLTAQELLTAAGCYSCIPPRLQWVVITHLLKQWNDAS